MVESSIRLMLYLSIGVVQLNFAKHTESINTGVQKILSTGVGTKLRIILEYYQLQLPSVVSNFVRDREK